MVKKSNDPPSMQVIIAALNEEEGIGPTIAELKLTLKSPKLLVIDGRSTDKTVQIAKNMGAHILFEGKLGKGNAIAKAVECCDPKADYVVLIDADHTYPARYIPKMVQIMEEDQTIGMVCGNRFNGQIDKKAMKDAFYLGNRLIAITHNLLNGIPLNDPLTGLRVVRGSIFRDWKVKSKGFDVEVELNHHVEREGSAIVEYPIVYRERLGKKKLRILHGAEILRRIMLETAY